MEQDIINAYPNLPSKIREKLRNKYPNVFNNDISIGDWIYNNSENVYLYLTSINSKGNFVGYGFYGDNWFDDRGTSQDWWRRNGEWEKIDIIPDDGHIIRELFDKEALRRGYNIRGNTRLYVRANKLYGDIGEEGSDLLFNGEDAMFPLGWK